MKISVCKIFSFDAAHFLPNYEGKCRRLHGHTWKLEVEVSGPVGEDGLVLDFAALKRLVEVGILEILDHTLLNDTIENPTCENLLEWIWSRLRQPWGLSSLLEVEKLRLWETPDSYSELKL
ncbi:6-carboxy-5,6,7,8-tetrahydropterin synthase [subsurface metagenome]